MNKKWKLEWKLELELLYKYASYCKFIIETGGRGKSTIFLARAALKNNAKFVTIEKKECQHIDGSEHAHGWSIAYEDIIKYNSPDFRENLRFVKKKHRNLKVEGRKYKKSEGKRYGRKMIGDFADRGIAYGNKFLMKGETDLIRKLLKKYNNKKLDFFFCDTGEYCGLAEWNIVKEKIIEGGYFSCHDIYYPKSIKCFQIVIQIEENDKWEILEKTRSKQGLLIARKIKK